MSNKLTATLRLQLINAVSGEAKDIERSLAGVNKSLKGLGKGATPALDQLARKLELLKRQSRAYDDYRRSSDRRFAAGAEFTRARQELNRLLGEMAKVGPTNRGFNRDLFAARNSVKLAAAALREESAAARGARTALEGLVGVSGGKLANSQKRIRDEIKRTTEALRQAEREARNQGDSLAGRTAGGLGTVATGVGATYYGAKGAKTAFFNSVNMDEATRFQRAVGGISPGDQKPLTTQAFKIGQETRYTNQDVVDAQTQIIQAGVRDIDTVIALTEAVKNYSLAMRVTMEEGADTVRSVLQSTNKDISDPEKAKAVADAMVNFVVDMAKRGGMADEDIRQFFKYGGASGKASGFSDSTLGSVGIQLRRGGMRGDEAGVFMRSASGKMVAPTSKGLDALNAMGLSYSDYVSMPDVLSSDNIERKFQRDFGKRLSKNQKADLTDLLETGTFIDPKSGEEMPISADQGIFTEQVANVLSGSFKKNKKGEMNAKDAQALAQSIAEYYKLAAESVDVERLFNDIMSANPSLAQLNAMFTERQGGRAATVRDRYASFKADKAGLENVPSDRAKKIGDEVHGGVYGEWMQATGAVETLFTKIGQDWEVVVSPMLRGFSNTVDAIANLPSSLRMLGTAATAAAIALGGIAASRVLSGLLGFGSGAAGGSVLGGLLGGGLKGGIGSLLGNGGTLALGGYLGAQYLLSQLFPAEGVKGRPGQYGNKMFPDRTAGKSGISDVRPMPGIQGESSLDQLKAKAIETGRVSQEALNFTATPQVSTASVDSFIARVKAAVAAMSALGTVSPSGGQGAPSTPAAKPNSSVISHRAAGGPVAAGRDYIVGEHGPERVTFGSNGYVTPTSKAGFGARIGKVNFHISSNDPHAVAREVDRVLNSLLARSQDLAIDGRMNF